MCAGLKHSPARAPGFTLLELILTLVILGVLAITLMPKFVDLSSEAQVAAISQVEASLSVAINLAVAKHQTADNPGNSIDYNGTTLTFIQGLPRPDAAQLRALLNVNLPSQTYTPNWNSTPCSDSDYCVVGRRPYSDGTIPSIPQFTSGTGIFIWPRGYTLSSCFAYYLNLETGTSPIVSSVTSGC